MKIRISDLYHKIMAYKGNNVMNEQDINQELPEPDEVEIKTFYDLSTEQQEKLGKISMKTKQVNIVNIKLKQNIDYLCSKVGGSPFWPEDLQRPMCDYGHHLLFIAQVLTNDIPNFPKDKVIYFHYCAECCFEGNMPFGYWDDNKKGYSVTILDVDDNLVHDGAGKNVKVSKAFIGDKMWDIIDEGKMECTLQTELGREEEIHNVLQRDDMDEVIEKFLNKPSEGSVDNLVANTGRTKLGGYMFPVQYYEDPGDNFQFAFQLYGNDFGSSSWCTGAVYIFVDFEKNIGELVLQTT